MFTIGIPAYKSKFLKECIGSVLSQTYMDFELVIVNDKSPDNISGIVDNYHDNRISYYENESNFGAVNVVDNWNKCLSYAKGDFFILMGDDDKMAPNYLEEFSNLIRRYPDLDVYHCRTCIINEKSECISVTSSWPEWESVYENIWHRIKGYRQQYISDFVYRTDVLKSNEGFYKLPLAWASDDISSFIAMGEKGIAHTQKILFYYRDSSITISKSGSSEFKIIALYEEKEWYLNFIENSIPHSEYDNLFKKNISEYLDKYIHKKKIYTIVEDLKAAHVYNIFQWILKKRKNKIMFSELLYALILYIKGERMK